MSGKVFDVPPTKKCCTNCVSSFLNPRPELSGMEGLGKFPLCTCKHLKHRKVLQDPRKEVCEEFHNKQLYYL